MFGFRKKPQSPPRFAVPATAEMLLRHGFSYSGCGTSGKELSAIESHYFVRSDCMIVVDFAHHIDYGTNGISIGDPAVGELGTGRLENWAYFQDYPQRLNAYIETGMTRDQAIAATLDDHVEYAARLYATIKSNGHRIPSSDDRD